MGQVESADGKARHADRFIVAGCTPWARRVFDERLYKLPGEWVYVETPLELERTVIEFKPRLAFVLHWRWRILPVVLGATNFIGFHLGSFARYRGGTPLQHQILSGELRSALTIYRMVEEMDAGPEYAVKAVALDGSAEAIYARAMAAAADWIASVVYGLRDGRPLWEPRPGYLGRLHARRTPAQSRLPEWPDAEDEKPLESTHDFIRMLDAEGYPHAFLDHGPYRFTFRRAVLYDGRVECDCTISLREGSGE